MNDKLYKFDGLDEAIVGLGTQANGEMLIVYSYEKMLDIFMADGMTEEEAEEHIDFNVAGLNIGESTPFIMHEMNSKAVFAVLGDNDDEYAEAEEPTEMQ